MDAALQPELIKLGQRLHSLRQHQGWTLADLGQQCQLSEAYLSRLESGERQPSLAVLFKLAQVYRISISDLFQDLLSPAGEIIRAGDRLWQQGNGLFFASLAGGGSLTDLQSLHLVVPASRHQDQLYQHNGEEWLYVISGQLCLTLVNQTFILNPGDAAHFKAYLPHRLAAISDQDAEVILVACAPTSSLLQSYLTGG